MAVSTVNFSNGLGRVRATLAVVCCALAAAAIFSAPVLAQETPAQVESPTSRAPSSNKIVMAQIRSQADNPFAALVGKRRSRDSNRDQRGNVERYVLASDDRVFLLQERGGSARVQFLCSPEDPRFECVFDAVGPAPEIYQLTATRGPRGDVIYKTSEDATLLRIAVYGGATVFWPGETRGVAASKSFGDDKQLALSFEPHAVAVRRAQGAAAHVSAKVGAPLLFDLSRAPIAAGANASVLADAVMTAAKGIIKVANDPTGARVIGSRITSVSFSIAAEPFVELDGAALKIGLVPDRDINGRPSSAAVSQYLEETL